MEDGESRDAHLIEVLSAAGKSRGQALPGQLADLGRLRHVSQCGVIHTPPMSNTFFRSKSVFITGASSGIGEELARQLAAAGARLTLTARRRELLEALAAGIAAAGHESPLVMTADVTRGGDLNRAVSEAVRAYGKLDIVFANAGFGIVGSFAALTVDDYRRQLETNLFGLLRTLYAGLSEVRKARGNLVLIGSVAG